MEFVHHPDGYLRIADGDQTYIDSPQSFALDYGEAVEPLPEGCTGRLYQTGKRHALLAPGNQTGGPMPWPAGDAYLAALGDLLAAQHSRRNQPPELDDLKRLQCAAVDAMLLSLCESGMPYLGKVLQIRDQDQQNVIAMSQRAALASSGAVSWPEGFAWRMADNSFLALPTPADMIAMATAAADEVYRLRLVAWAHKDAIDACATEAAVLAYDIETGW